MEMSEYFFGLRRSVKGLSPLFQETSKMFQDPLKTCCQANNVKLNSCEYFASVFLLKKQFHPNQGCINVGIVTFTQSENYFRPIEGNQEADEAPAI